MREHSICRRCNSSYSTRGAFSVQGSKPHYAPDLPFKLEHIRLDVTVDPKGKTLHGEAKQKVVAVSPGQTRIRLDQIGLKIESVQVAGRDAKFSIEGDHLDIALQEAPAVGSSFEFTVKYQVSQVRRGLYFTGPDENYPNKRFQVWSQGQDEDNRYWFPTFDYPNQKATSEIIAKVPQGFTAVSNGALLSKKDEGAHTVFHYRLGTPHVTYLITLTVGEFVEWQDQGPSGLPVQYFVEPGREEDGKRAFGNTPSMIESFAKKIGVAYPYEKYSQVAVQDFIFGGMENTSATTQTDLTLHDARAHLDFSSDPLVAHELAHQWFGDLLTCRDWSHGWLNEGFATFMERIWIECSQEKVSGVPVGGLEEAKYYSYMDLKEYLDEDRLRYRRPIVCNTYIEPIDLFDYHLYQKGGLVLNFVRYVLGEDLFWQSIKNYVTRHQGQNVETLDLIRAIEDTTGRNLRRLFDEWVFGAGYPELELSYQWHEDKKLVELVVEQKQTGGAAELVQNGFKTSLFHLPVVVELEIEKSRVSHRFDIAEARERIFLPATAKPLSVRFDPGNWIPKTLSFPRPKEMLLHILKSDPDCMGRVEAALELGKIADSEVITALKEQLLKDSFWGVQAEVAGVLAELRTSAARDALIDSLGRVTHPKARRAVVRALGSFKDKVVAEALLKVSDQDASYYVEADAISAWVNASLPLDLVASSKLAPELEKTLLSRLAKPSYREVIRSEALHALSKLPGIEKGERPLALQTLLEWASAGKPQDARMAAVGALGEVARLAAPSEKAKILEKFSSLADEENFRIRMRLIMAIGRSGRPEAASILEKIRTLDLDGRVKRDAMGLAEKLQAGHTTDEAIAGLRASLAKLEEEQKKLRSQLEETRAGLGAKT
jgi:aminopeptidase N